MANIILDEKMQDANTRGKKKDTFKEPRNSQTPHTSKTTKTRNEAELYLLKPQAYPASRLLK
jgi:hypothetical protein